MQCNQVLIFSLALAASVLVIFGMLHVGFHGSLDEPNDRSLHVRPVPRSGGLGILIAALIGLLAAQGPWIIGACVALIAAVSWLDDQFGLPIWLRFIFHIAAAIGLLLAGLVPTASAGYVALVIVGMVWMTNLYNFMDGADGLAGGMALFGFGTYAIAAALSGERVLLLLSGSIAAGAIGFLFFNFHPARIFMGDIGSISLGFLAGALGLEGVRLAVWPLWFPLFVFSPFILDATLTLGKRALRGERVWRAHREHYYQRMVQSGLGHRKTALLWYVIMIAAAASGIMLLHAETVHVLVFLCLWMATYVVLAWMIDRRWKRYKALGET